MKIMTGIDLHSNNAVCGLMDMDGRRLLHKKVPCDLKAVLDTLAPYKERIDTIVVESTYNWYWLVDGLQDDGYKVLLANPARIQQYDGLKHTDDKSDAYFLAELQRLGILPTGYLYDRQTRPVRDLLRRRLGLVRQRTALLLSAKSLYARNTGGNLALSRLKALEPAAAAALYTHPCDQLIAQEQVQLIGQLGQSIEKIEKTLLAQVKKLPCYTRLKTIPGIGVILALTITLETGQARRFPSPGDFASYCRCVRTQRLSNSKSKGRNNGKCGNKYLAWAFVEAANYARRFDEPSRKFFDRKTAATNGIVATKSLACKLAKAAWHVMTDGVDYDGTRVFGGGGQESQPGTGQESPEKKKKKIFEKKKRMDKPITEKKTD